MDRLKAGAWANDILCGLSWVVPRGEVARRPAVERAPSWSWLCIEGPLVFTSELVCDRSCRVLGFEVAIGSGDSFSVGGRLILETKVERLASLVPTSTSGPRKTSWRYSWMWMQRGMQSRRDLSRPIL